MNAQMKQHRPVTGETLPRSSARAPSAAQPSAQFPPVAEDRSIPSQPAKERPWRVDPLWMITAAGALMFLFFAAMVSF